MKPFIWRRDAGDGRWWGTVSAHGLHGIVGRWPGVLGYPWRGRAEDLMGCMAWEHFKTSKAAKAWVEANLASHEARLRRLIEGIP